MKMEPSKFLFVIFVILVANYCEAQRIAIGSGLINDELTIISGQSDTLYSGVLTSNDDVDLYCKVFKLPIKKRKVIDFYINSLRVSTLGLDKKILKKGMLIVVDFNFAEVNGRKYLVNVDYKWLKDSKYK